nr:hypothetical protein Iba_chr10cCG6980 [Ipomoea batatas]
MPHHATVDLYCHADCCQFLLPVLLVDRKVDIAIFAFALTELKKLEMRVIIMLGSLRTYNLKMGDTLGHKPTISANASKFWRLFLNRNNTIMGRILHLIAPIFKRALWGNLRGEARTRVSFMKTFQLHHVRIWCQSRGNSDPQRLVMEKEKY